MRDDGAVCRLLLPLRLPVFEAKEFDKALMGALMVFNHAFIGVVISLKLN